MPAPTAICIGNFDGVHLGHVELVRRARGAVGADGRVTVLSFDPHPRTVLTPSAQPGRISRFAQRQVWLREAGADAVERVEPTRELLGQSPEAFVADLATRHRPAFIVEGPDFRFGRGRAGTVETLRALEAEFGFRTLVIEPVNVPLTTREIVTVGSTMVRWLVVRGRVGDAAALLGRPYELTGLVVSGDRRGRTIGVPTANLDFGDMVLPADGIYAGLGHRADGAGGLWIPAAISVGTKPTFGTHPRTCEAHLLHHEGALDDYGWTLELRFVHWIRDQLRYDDEELLVAQIRRDIGRTGALIGASVPEAV